MDEHRPPRELLDTSVRYSPDAAACEILTAPIRNVLAEVDRRIAGNEPAGAEHLLLQLRRAAPGSVHVNMLLAGLYCEHRQYSNALPLLNAVLAVDTQFSPAMVRKADALYRLDRVGEAVAIARTLATLDPNNAEYLNNLGTYQQAAGNFEEAGTAFSQAIAIRPDFVAAWHNLLQLPDRTLDGAQLEHVKALCTDPALSDRQRAMASLCVGRHYRMRGDVSREFAWLERGKSALAELSPWD
ncbi:MAG: tetratricopeptide repeat protein, partial [Gammaproteobacteria bacterium]